MQQQGGSLEVMVFGVHSVVSPRNCLQVAVECLLMGYAGAFGGTGFAFLCGPGSWSSRLHSKQKSFCIAVLLFMVASAHSCYSANAYYQLDAI